MQHKIPLFSLLSFARTDGRTLACSKTRMYQKTEYNLILTMVCLLFSSQVCLCTQHTNVKFAFEDLLENCKKCQLPVPSAEHYVELVDDMLCPPDTRTRSCLKEQCPDCGPDVLQEQVFTPLIENATSFTFDFRSIEKDERGRLAVVKKTDRPVEEFVEHFKGKLHGFPMHRFLSKNQKNEMNTRLDRLDPGTLVLISDYAEKFVPKEMEEIQSMHWSSSPLTILNIVALFDVPDPDGDKLLKVKIYFSFITERPEQDSNFVAHCHRLVLLWIYEIFGLTFKEVDLLSDRCAVQFCCRKVFGLLAESRQNLCINHDASEPICSNCPKVCLHFSCAGHGKCEVDHIGAYIKTSLRRRELHHQPLRSTADITDHLQTLNFVNLKKTAPGKEDERGFRYSGLYSQVVSPEDVVVSNADYKTITGTRSFHQIITTPTSGQLLIRESSCFSCAACEFSDYENCHRVEELGQISRVTVQPVHAQTASTSQARDDSSETNHPQSGDTADLATPGCLIAVAKGQRQKLVVVLVTSALNSDGVLKGKVLKNMPEMPNRFTTANATYFTFDSALVRSSPLLFTSSPVITNQKNHTVYTLNEIEFNCLMNTLF